MAEQDVAEAAPAQQADGQEPTFASVSEGTYRLQAPLQFATVPELRDRGLELIDAAPAALTLDLSRVTAADSAGLALLIDWLAAAQATHKRLQYVHPPQTLLALARLSDVERLLSARAD